MTRENPSGRRQRRPRGSEAAYARSALTLRLILSGVALPLFLAGCVAFAIAAARDAADARPVWIFAAAVCGLTALIAWIDLLVILRRRRTGR